MIESPRSIARIAGLFYVGTILFGLFAELVREGFIVSGDAAATAHNIVASEPLYRWGFAGDLIGGACYAVVTLLLYKLLRPVNAAISLLAATFSFVGIAIGAVIGLARLAPLFLLGGASYTKGFDTAQLQSAAYLALKLHGQGYLIALVFFGVYCCLIGWLVFKSGFMPKTIGVLMAIAGVCYLVNSFTSFLAPPLASVLSTFILLPCLVGEGALTLWLVAFGVNVERWKDLAATRGALLA